MPGGVTPSERYLGLLCEQSFLSLWCYPNVFNDKGIENGGTGKEVCDLLVVFGDNIIIFSDKSCEFKETGRLSVDWNRWYRKAIRKSIDQLHGAERWITQYPHRLYLDDRCTQPFPLDFPPLDRRKVHRIAVALGAKDACRSFYGGGSGSLRICSDQDPLMLSDDERQKAFTIGGPDIQDGCVHVFDDVTLDVLMQELDTIADFCEYLQKKEALLQTMPVLAAGEEDVLGYYLSDITPDGRHGFPGAMDVDTIVIEEGFWQYLVSADQFQAKKVADQVSYIWDNLIEHFHGAYGRGEVTEEIPIAQYELAVRKMASLNRFERRTVGARVKSLFETTGSEDTRFAAAIPHRGSKIAFAFVFLPPHSDRPYGEYVSNRRALLAAYAKIVRHKHPTVDEVLGLAMEPHKEGRGGSEDLAYFDLADWTEEDEAQAISDMTMLGLKAEATYFSEREYPEPTATGA